MSRLYQYVGPKKIAQFATSQPSGFIIGSPDAVRRWILETEQTPNRAGEIIATFIVDQTHRLLLADRRSEHVACAGCQPVHAAGEIAFQLLSHQIQITWITNQSTGYCPEPESWGSVEKALLAAGLTPPHGFSPSFEFRYCLGCGSINLVKDARFECAICNLPLPFDWNCDLSLLGPNPSTLYFAQRKPRPK